MFWRVVIFICIILNYTTSSFAGNEGATDISFENSLVNAADQGDINTVQHLLQSGAKVDSRGLFGITPLMRAAYNGNEAIAQLLIHQGANVDASDIGGATALHIAARRGNSNIVKLLLDKKAIVDISDNEGWTPLMRAANSQKTDIVDMLLKSRANPTKENKWHNTAALIAAHTKNTSLIKTMAENNAFANITPLDRERILAIIDSPELKQTIRDSATTSNIAAPDNKAVPPTINTVENEKVALIDNTTPASTETPAIGAQTTMITPNMVTKNKPVIAKEDLIELPSGANILVNADNQQPTGGNVTAIPQPSQTVIATTPPQPKTNLVVADTNTLKAEKAAEPQIAKLHNKDQAKPSKTPWFKQLFKAEKKAATQEKKLAEAKPTQTANAETLIAVNKNSNYSYKEINNLPWLAATLEPTANNANPDIVDKPKLPDTNQSSPKTTRETASSKVPDTFAQELEIITATQTSNPPQLAQESKDRMRIYEAVQMPPASQDIEISIPETISQPDIVISAPEIMSVHPVANQVSDEEFWVEIPAIIEAALASDIANRITEYKPSVRISIVTPFDFQNEEYVGFMVGPVASIDEAQDICHIATGDHYNCSITGNMQTEEHVPEYITEKVSHNEPLATPNNSKKTEYWVQLGTFTSKKSAKRFMQSLKDSHQKLLANLNENISSPQNNYSDKPIYRLRLGPFASYQAAEKKCNALAKRNVTCTTITS